MAHAIAPSRKPGRTPRWRGVTAMHEPLDAGIPWQSVAISQLDAPLSRAVAMVGPPPSYIVREPPAGA